MYVILGVYKFSISPTSDWNSGGRGEEGAILIIPEKLDTPIVYATFL